MPAQMRMQQLLMVLGSLVPTLIPNVRSAPYEHVYVQSKPIVPRLDLCAAPGNTTRIVRFQYSRRQPTPWVRCFMLEEIEPLLCDRSKNTPAVGRPLSQKRVARQQEMIPLEKWDHVAKLSSPADPDCQSTSTENSETTTCKSQFGFTINTLYMLSVKASPEKRFTRSE